MSYDDLKIEYYLISNSWVEGTHKFYNKVQGKEIQRPQNAIQTWIYHETNSSIYSREVKTFRMHWSSPEVDELTIKSLHEKFSDPK